MAVAYDLNGKVALITGAARGIGLEVARSLHKRGASVAIVDLNQDDARQAAASIGGERTLGLPADVTDWNSIRAVVNATVEQFGGLDIVVANAGIANDAATVRVMETGVFEKVIDVNLLGVYRTVHVALPHIVERKGQVVLISSIYSFMNGVFVSPYAISKAGVEQLGRALRVELAHHGGSAMVVYFGFVATEMVRRGFEDDPLAERYRERIPSFMSRRIRADEAGEAIARGLERRAHAVTRPRFWSAFRVMRGIVGPALDRRFLTDKESQALVGEVDVEGRIEQLHRVDASA
jgi:NAD(P)-dependent dehydrogenase (short-subunit alcohol dehydrogenase family)